jgi:hypothetical protein
MKIGGSSHETWMMLIPLVVAIGVSTVLLGGPGEALSRLERMAHDAWDVVGLWMR